MTNNNFNTEDAIKNLKDEYSRIENHEDFKEAVVLRLDGLLKRINTLESKLNAAENKIHNLERKLDRWILK